MGDGSQECTSVQLEQEQGQKSIQLSPAKVRGQPVNQTSARRDCEKRACLSVRLCVCVWKSNGSADKSAWTRTVALCNRKKITACLQTQPPCVKINLQWLTISSRSRGNRCISSGCYLGVRQSARRSANKIRWFGYRSINLCAMLSHLSVFLHTHKHPSINFIFGLHGLVCLKNKMQ